MNGRKRKRRVNSYPWPVAISSLYINWAGSTKQGNYLAVTAILNRDISVDI